MRNKLFVINLLNQYTRTVESIDRQDFAIITGITTILKHHTLNQQGSIIGSVVPIIGGSMVPVVPIPPLGMVSTCLKILIYKIYYWLWQMKTAKANLTIHCFSVSCKMRAALAPKSHVQAVLIKVLKKN